MVRLLLEDTHVQHCHQGVGYLRALIQQRHAMVNLQATLRTIVSRCVTCSRRKVETVRPVMADLSRERLAFEERPFANTGVDYFGHLFVTVRLSTEKRWVFFHLPNVRAVHFEVVPTIDTRSCVIGIE